MTEDVDVDLRFEIPAAQWAEIRATVRHRLIQSARVPRLVSCSSLVSELPLDGALSPALAEMLGEINEQCAGRGEPLLGAIAVNVTEDHKNEPASGFYESALAAHLLNEDSSEQVKLDVWASEVGKCFKFWATHR